MNILHVTHLYLPSVGGTEVHTRELSIELAKIGHRVSIFTTDGIYLEDLFPKLWYKTKNLGEAEFNDSNVVVYRFHVINSLLISLAIKYLSLTCDGIRKLGLIKQDTCDYIKALKHSPFTPKLYIKLIKSTNIDVVNSTPFPFGYSLLVKELCKRKRIPFIITPRAHILSGFYSQPFLIRTVKEADAVIALTECERAFFIEKGVSEDKIFVTGIGISPENYQNGDVVSFKTCRKIPQNSKIVLFIGRLAKGKGIELLLESMKIVWNKIPDVHLVLLGRSTEYTQSIIDIVREEKKVIVLPDATEKTKIDALLSSNLLVLPSIYESFGGVFLEAWSAEIPVIGCKTPTVKCVVDNMVNGLLTSFDKYELAENIIYLLENEDEARRMGKKGKEKVLRNYTWKIIAEKTLKVYEALSKT